MTEPIHKSKAFDRVLVRNYYCDEWTASLYSHFDFDNVEHKTIANQQYLQCVPYKGNEHLLGTTNQFRWELSCQH